MNVDWAAVARRHWALVLATAILLGFAVVHAATFRPTLRRYQADSRQAAELGMPLDPGAAPAGISGPEAALLAENSLAADVAEDQGGSGSLTADLIDTLNRLAARSGLAVVATERGLVTQLPGTVQVRAHLKLRGDYAGFVRLLDAMSGSRRLIRLDRFAMQPGAGGAAEVDAWFTQLLLKRRAGAR